MINTTETNVSCVHHLKNGVVINMVEFETIKSEEMKFGSKNFLEIARKKAVSEKGINEFIAISRGFFGQDGSKRYTKSVAIPVDPTMVDFIRETLAACVEGAPAIEQPAEVPAEDTPVEESVEQPAEETPAEESVEQPAEAPAEDTPAVEESTTEQI